MARRRRSGNSRAPYRRPLQFEPLEDRRLLAVATVTTLADTIDFTDGVTSLREAIFATNTVAGADTIEFDPSLTATGPVTILLTQGELLITDALTINGPGADLLTINAQQQSRIFDFVDGDGLFAIEGLSLTGGQTAEDGASGGAILAEGDLNVQRTIFRDNRTFGANSGGGAIASSGIVVLNDSVVSGNSTAGPDSPGGGVFGTGEIMLTNCSISGNRTSAIWSPGGGVYAGGVRDHTDHRAE